MQFDDKFFSKVEKKTKVDKNTIIELAKNIEEKDKEIIINICGDGPQLNEFKEKAKGNFNIKQ